MGILNRWPLKSRLTWPIAGWVVIRVASLTTPFLVSANQTLEEFLAQFNALSRNAETQVSQSLGDVRQSARQSPWPTRWRTSSLRPGRADGPSLRSGPLGSWRLRTPING